MMAGKERGERARGIEEGGGYRQREVDWLRKRGGGRQERERERGGVGREVRGTYQTFGIKKRIFFSFSSLPRQ